VPSDDLSSIPDLQDKHRKVLADQLKITTLRAFIDADLRDVYQAMRNLRPRPTLEQITRWQDQSRGTPGEATTQAPDWHPAASFVVVFAQRRVGDGWEHRLEVERTEVEPEQERRIWPGWECGEICAWMREQVSLPDRARPGSEAGRSSNPAGTPARPSARAAEARERARIQIGSAMVIDPTTRVDVLAADTETADRPADLTGPLRVEITVSGARRGQEVHTVARILRPGEPGWNPQDPVVIKGPGKASFDLSRLPAGQYDIKLVAWAPDGTAIPAAVSLPRLTIQPAAGPPGQHVAGRDS
jgi:hypothetical protein